MLRGKNDECALLKFEIRGLTPVDDPDPTTTIVPCFYCNGGHMNENGCLNPCKFFISKK